MNSRDSVLAVLTRVHGDQAAGDLAYWRSKSMRERLEAVMQIRREHHGEDDEAAQGFERVLVRVERR
jgi:hypothetical protein